MKAIVTVVLCIQLVVINGWTAEPITFIQSSSVSTIEFEAFLKSHPKTISYSSFQAQQSPTEQQRQELNKILSEAQGEFLTGSLEKARQSFELITLLVQTADWSIEEREAINLSFLRLAQLSPKSDEKNKWLIEAVRFDPEIEPNSELVPPPLVMEFNEVKRKQLTQFKKWNVQKFADDYTIIKLDGRLYDLRGTKILGVPPGPHRLAILSNKVQPIVRVLSADQILALTPSTPPLAEGDCETPQTQTQVAGILYPRGCAVVSERGSWVKFSIKKADSENTKNLFSTPKPSPNWVSSTETNTSSAKTWLFIGVAAAAVGVVVYFLQKQKTDPGTVTTQE